MDSPLSIIDAIVITFTFLSTILAMARGITREILGVLSVLGASFIAIYFSEDLAPTFSSFVNLEPIAQKFAADSQVIAIWLTGAIVFIVLWIIFTVITAKLARAINNSAVSGIDSVLGLVFGMLRGLFIIGIVYTMYTHFISPEKYFDSVKNAKLKPILDETSDFIIDAADLILPERISKGFDRKTEAVYLNDSPSTSSK